MKKIFIGLTLLLMLLFFGCGDDNNSNGDTPGDTPGTMYITSVQVNAPETNILFLDAGNPPQIQCAATISPASLPDDDKKVVWSSENEAVVTVNQSGLVSVIGAGAAKVIATSVAKNRNGVQVSNNVEFRVRTEDPAILRWIADNDPTFDMNREIGPRETVSVSWKKNVHDELASTTFTVLGTPIKPVLTANGEKGYLFNYIDPVQFPRDPANDNMYTFNAAPEVRSTNSRILIGCTDYGTYEEIKDSDGDGTGIWGYTGQSNSEWAPSGTIDIYRNVTIRIGYSDMTPGVDGSGTPAREWGFQMWVLNNTTTSGNSPMPNSRILSDQPASGGIGIDGETMISFNGTSLGTTATLQNMLKQGFFSFHSGYGRQMILRYLIIEPTDW